MKQIHVAIMRKSWNLTEKILTGGKTIESRWYLKRSKPWDNIKPGDTIYFKNSGEPIKIKTIASKILQFDDLKPQKVKNILEMYGSAGGIDKSDISSYFERFKNKKYCLLIFLKNVKVVSPIEIDKTGFGSMSAWLTVQNIKEIKKR